MNEVLAVGVTLVHTIADGRQISFSTAFAEDMSKEKRNALLDDLMSLSNRQKAISDRPDVEAELLKHRETLAQYQEDMARLEAEFPTKQAAREASLQALVKGRDNAREEQLAEFTEQYEKLTTRRAGEFNTGYKEHLDRGRTGEYKPSGHREANLRNMDKELEQARETIKNAMVQFEVDYDAKIGSAREEIHKAAAEREVALSQMTVSVRRYEQAIANYEARLVDIDKALGG